jgi:hypothetical protein
MSRRESESEGSSGEYSIDVEDQLQEEDTLIDRGVDDVLDEGYSPVERPLNHNDVETLDERLSEEEPDVTDDDSPFDENRMGDEEVGDRRAGRLAASGEGEIGEDSELFGIDEGIDGGAASAEEAAVHIIAE